MGKGGRPRQPTALKILRGNPGRRPLNAAEPKFKPGSPRRPKWVSEDGKRLWASLEKLLTKVNVLTEGDGAALTLLVEAYADWLEARETVAVEGATYTSDTPTGIIIRPHPAVAIRDSAWRRVAGMLREFGLTPSSRSDIRELVSRDEDDPLAELLFGDRHG